MFRSKKQKRIDELEDQLRRLIAAAEEMQQRPYLFSIERKDRLNRFTFVRNHEMHVVETMGLISDDIRGWREKLLD